MWATVIIKLQLLLGGYKTANRPSMLTACDKYIIIGKIFYDINTRIIKKRTEKRDYKKKLKSRRDRE